MFFDYHWTTGMEISTESSASSPSDSVSGEKSYFRKLIHGAFGLRVDDKKFQNIRPLPVRIVGCSLPEKIALFALGAALCAAAALLTIPASPLFVTMKFLALGVSGLAISWPMVASKLYTEGLPDPDIIVRTSGEQRLSNFLLLQAAYSEFYFTDTFWPDVREETFVEILREYSKRERRMGGI